MSIFIQEVLGLLHRNKKKNKVDYKRDYVEIGRVNQSSVGNPGYQPAGEPFIIKLGDLKCQILENVVLQSGTASLKGIPMYAPLSGTCVTKNTSIEESIISQSSDDTTININGRLDVFTDLLVRGRSQLKKSVELGTLGDVTSGTALLNQVLDSNASSAGVANRILRSLPDGRVVWSDDDPVVSLTYGSIWRGSAANVKEELAIGTAEQVLTSDGTTASWANPAVSGTGSANNITMWTSATTIGNSAPVPMIQSGTGASATLTIGDGNDQNIVTDGILYLNGPVRDAGGNFAQHGMVLVGDSSSQVLWQNTFSFGFTFLDNVKLTFGDPSIPGDLEISHDSNNSIIKDTGTGSLFIQGSNLILQAGLTKNAIICGDSDSVDIYYNGALKLQTANTGIKITGGILDVNDQLGTAGQVLSSTGTTLDWIDASILGSSGTPLYLPMWATSDTLGNSIVSQNAANELITVAGAINVSGTNANPTIFNNSGIASNEVLNFKGSARFDDNAILRFGAGTGDMSIYHSTVNNDSIISDVGPGNLQITGKQKIEFREQLDGDIYAVLNQDGSAQLYHNNVKKIATTSSGVEITGEAVATNFAGSGSTLTDVNTYVDNVAGVPATATSTGTAGEIKFDENYIYVCYATNSWRRVAVATW